MSKILIKNGKIWDGEKFFISDLLTDNGKIALISEDIKESADFVYDAKGKIVSSGLIDIHTHMLGHYGINPDLVCIPFGVTCAAEASALPNSMEKYENFLINNKVFISTEIKNNQLNSEKAEKMLEYYSDKAIGLKVYFDSAVSEITDTSPLKEAVKLAEKHNICVMVHSTNSPVPMFDIVSALRKGDILTHAYHGGANNAEQDGFECLKLAKQKGVVTDTGFAGNVHTDFKIFENAIKSGYLPDTISTDITNLSAYKRGGRYGITMCMSMAKTAGMCEEDIFRAVTSSAAKAISMDDQCGYLEIGRCADISVLKYTDEAFELTDKNGNILKNDKSYRCVMTIKDGNVLFRI